MPTSSSSMATGSKPFDVCVSIASVSAFIALAAILVLVWLWLKHVSPREREELELEIADLQRQLSDAQNQGLGERRSSSSLIVANRIPGSRWQDEGLRKAKGELENERKRVQNLAKQNERLQNERQREMEDERRASEMMRSQIEELRRENAQLKAYQPRAGTQTRKDTYQLHKTNKSLQATEEEPSNAAQTLSTQMANMNREWEMKLDLEKKQHQDLLARNEHLQDELSAIRKYGNMEDQYAGAEVKDRVEKLNSDILQVAATVAEGLEVDEWANDRRVVENSNAKDLAKIIGKDLLDLLRVSASQNLNIVLQTAFQASMVFYMKSIVSSWCYNFAQDELLFNECYKSMQKNELQAVSGRWRQLAMTHLKGSRSSYQQYLLPALTKTLAEVVVTAGYRQDFAFVRKFITERFAHRLEGVIKAAQELHGVVGEGVTSCDLSVIWYRPGTTYDASMMEDPYGPKAVVIDREEVACVTDLGLKSTEKGSGSTMVKQLILLKAKVLLPSGLVGIRPQVA